MCNAKVSARGRWREAPAGSIPAAPAAASRESGGGKPLKPLLSSLVKFESVDVQPTQGALGLPPPPALHVPIFEPLQAEAAWMTTYLDANTRVGRGASGNVFVFRKV